MMQFNKDKKAGRLKGTKQFMEALDDLNVIGCLIKDLSSKINELNGLYKDMECTEKHEKSLQQVITDVTQLCIDYKDQSKKLLKKLFKSFNKVKRDLDMGSGQNQVPPITSLIADLRNLFNDVHTFILRTSQFNYRKKLDYDKHDIFIHVTTSWERLRSTPCKKEPWTVKWLEEYYKEGDVFYDIGANVGAYSLIASTITNKNCTIYAFEPSYSTYNSLCKNIIINNCSQTIIPMQIALSDTTEFINFKYRSLDAGESLHTITDKNQQLNEATKYSQVMMSFTIDYLVSELKVETPNHIKLDVDGTEFKVLKGGVETLKNENVKTIMAEINENEKDEVIKYMTSLNFKVESIRGHLINGLR